MRLHRRRAFYHVTPLLGVAARRVFVVNAEEMALSRWLAFAVVTCSGFLAFSAPGCSNQGEGERCDTDEDCQSDLYCEPAQTLGSNSSLCCPRSGNPTTLACEAGAGRVSAGGAGGAGTGGAGGATGGAGGETGGTETTAGNGGTGGTTAGTSGTGNGGAAGCADFAGGPPACACPDAAGSFVAMCLPSNPTDPSSQLVWTCAPCAAGGASGAGGGAGEAGTAGTGGSAAAGAGNAGASGGAGNGGAGAGSGASGGGTGGSAGNAGAGGSM